MWQQILQESLPWNSARLRLRVVAPDDAALLTELANNPEVRRYLGRPLNVSESGTRDNLIQRAGAAESLYIAQERETGKSIGCCGFTPNLDLGSDVTDMLIELLPEFQGRGYGSEILLLLRDAWLDIAGQPHCVATVWPENRAAIDILVRAGFAQQGEYKDFFGLRHLIFRHERSAGS